MKSLNPETYTFYCVPSYCSCTCPRSDCNCGPDEKFVDLKIACPAKGCPNEEVINWIHSMDNYHTQLSNKARIRCTKSNCTTDHMKNYSFECSSHRGEYRKTSSKTFRQALLLASCEGAIDEDVLNELTEYLKDPANKWN